MIRGIKQSSPQFLFPTDVFASIGTAPYMAHSIPVASDFYHPQFSAFLKTYNNHPFQLHRKLWEYAFILDRLAAAGMIAPGKRGLGFGVGQELLPAIFAAAGCRVTATDAPDDIGSSWTGSQEFARSADHLNHAGLLPTEEFLRAVEYRTCDMNALQSDLRDYDFCWSACCLEHLGSLQHGLDFIVNSIDTLKPGGVACHTTELNLSSNVETVETGRTVLYRRKDLEEFHERVRSLGHWIEPFVIPPMATPIDHHVDIPPYDHNPHLKLMLEGFVTTSIGVMIRRKD